MELTKQVCCLDFAKQLKELGVKQESCFGWYEGFKGSWFVGDMADVMNHARQISNSTSCGQMVG